MLGFGKVTCGFCKTPVRRRDVRKAQDGSKMCVCDRCYAAWETAGRKCPECNTPVHGMQDVGFLSRRSALGHADCGGAKLLRA